MWQGVARASEVFARPVAIKVMKRAFSTVGGPYLSMFLEEARIGARLQHVNAIQVAGVGRGVVPGRGPNHGFRGTIVAHVGRVVAVLAPGVCAHREQVRRHRPAGMRAIHHGRLAATPGRPVRQREPDPALHPAPRCAPQPRSRARTKRERADDPRGAAPHPGLASRETWETDYRF